MKTINPSRPPHPCATPSFFFAIAIAAIAIVCTADPQTKPLSAVVARIDALYSRIGDLNLTSTLHEDIALGLVFAHRFQAESLHALERLSSQPDSDLREVTVMLITHATNPAPRTDRHPSMTPTALAFPKTKVSPVWPPCTTNPAASASKSPRI